MSQTLTAMLGTPGITYCASVSGNAYRADVNGIVHVLASEVTEMSNKAAPPGTGNVALAVATAAQMASKGHAGDPLSYITQNIKDHG